MKIEILGTRCAKCKKLEEIVRAIVAESDIAAEVIKVEDITDIINYGVMLTPALVINGQVKTAGRIPSKEEIKSWIMEGGNNNGK